MRYNVNNHEAVKEKLFSIFPQYIKDFLIETTVSIGADPSYTLTSFLSVASICVGASAKVKIKNSWEEYPGLYTVLIGEPSSKKTPVINTVSNFMNELQKENGEEYRLNKKNKLKNPVDKPFLKRVYTTDSTMESLCQLMEQNPIGLIYSKDELKGLFDGLNAYKSGGGDLQEILQMYNNGTIMTTRKSAEDIQSDTPFLTIIGGMQITPFIETFAKESFGLKERFIFAFNTLKTSRKYSDFEISDNVIKEYVKGMMSVRRASEKSLLNKSVRTYKFSDEAFQSWVDWQNGLEDNPIYNSMFDKAIARCARFSLIIEILNNPKKQTLEIDISSMRGAIMLSNYYINNHKNALDLFESGTVKSEIEDVLNWLKKRTRDEKNMFRVNNSIGVKTSSLSNNKACGVKNASDARRKFELLEERGYGRIVKSTSKSYPTEIFCVLRWEV